MEVGDRVYIPGRKMYGKIVEINGDEADVDAFNDMGQHQTIGIALRKLKKTTVVWKEQNN